MNKNVDIFDSIAPNKKPELPNDYFKTLEKDLISNLEHGAVKEVSMFKKSSFWIGVASAACIGFIVLFTTQKTETLLSETAKGISFEEITTQEVEEYLNQSLTDLDEELIAEVFDIDSELELEKPKINFEDIDAEAIESYLDDYFIEENDNKNS